MEGFKRVTAARCRGVSVDPPPGGVREERREGKRDETSGGGVGKIDPDMDGQSTSRAASCGVEAETGNFDHAASLSLSWSNNSTLDN